MVGAFLSLPPVRWVCTNIELVMFQPRTVTYSCLGSVVNCYVDTTFFLTQSSLLRPQPGFPLGGGWPHSPMSTLPSNWRESTQDHSPTWESPFSVPAYQDLSLPAPYSDSSASWSFPLLSPHLSDFQRRSLDAAKISFKVSLSCFLVTVCLHHGYRRLPPSCNISLCHRPPR